jgi:uncharacterized protein (DUF1684 family)
MSIRYVVIMATGLMAAGTVDPAYVKSIQDYRTKIETTLKSDTGWLTVAGLHWLKPGATTVGSDASSGFVLPAGKAPAKLGVFHFDGKTVKFEAAAGSQVQVNGKPFQSGTLVDDYKDRTPDALTVGDLTMTIIDRGGKIGVRLRDKSSKYRKEFTHRSWFAVKPEYKVEGKLIPYAEPKKLRVATVIDGVVEEHESPGEIEFALNGATHKAQVLKAGEGQLWLIFRDRTSNKATYPAGRFLYGEWRKDNTVTFDFNKAYNPPCAFTPFATCPLPPRQNSLKTAVEAGELTYHIEP